MVIINPWAMTEHAYIKWTIEAKEKFHKELDLMNYSSEEEKRIVRSYADKAWDRAVKRNHFPLFPFILA